MAKRTCDVPGCEEKHNARGFCLLHYMRVMRSGDVNAGKVNRGAVCSIDGCENAHKGYGLCDKHYARFKRHGDPLAPARGGPGYQAPHGSVGRYEYHGCRCEECVDAANAARRGWRSTPAAKRRHAERTKEARGLYRDRIAVLKLADGCADCGYAENSVALDFDHVRGDKLFNVSRGSGYPWQTVLDEIAKCDVVCANCHRIRTSRRTR